MTDDAKRLSTNPKRRAFLASATLGAGAVILQPAAAECAHAADNAGGTSPGLTAQTTEGPYYLPLDLMRNDITEGLPGIPLDIAFTVLTEDGKPYINALVDVWHCDSQGIYSGFGNPGPRITGADTRGKTFLRGTQPVGADGMAVFHSIYPGWYQGRTTHIHFKIRRRNLVNLTSQFFLPDTLSEYLYTQVPTYRRTSLRDTLNSTDGIAIDAGQTVEGSVREVRGRYIASLNVRVDRNANPPIDRPPAPGEPPPRAGEGAQQQKGALDRPPPMPQPLRGAARVAAMLPNAPRVANHPPPLPPGQRVPVPE
jgi:protocatechuate 3,4-dioxygenase beta subunit